MGEGGIGGSAAGSVEETADGEESVNEKGHTQEGSGQKENGTDAKPRTTLRVFFINSPATLRISVTAC